MTEAWTQELPRANGVYWYRTDPSSKPDVIQIHHTHVYYTGEAAVYDLTNHAGGEFLGPINPTDTEEVARPVTVQYFRITPNGNGYYTVPDPNYKGGEAVSAKDYDAKVDEADRLRSTLEGGVGVIAQERQRQIEVKGYTPEHDDEHDLGELGLAAALYALPYDAKLGDEPLLDQADFVALHITLETGCNFFVDPEPDVLRRLAKAGALIAAEIDRRTRAARAALDTTKE